MQANVGQTDKTLRMIAGLVIITLGVVMGSWWGAIGLVPLITGLVNWCPAYSLFGINSCKLKNPS